MKKVSIVLSVLLVMAMLVPLASNAGPNTITPNPTITVPKVTPTIDGTISDSEGWSATASLNEATVGYFWLHQPLTTNGDIKFAYDDNGFYYCMNIVEIGSVTTANEQGVETTYDGNSFIMSTGEDDIDATDEANNYGWNGDVVVFAMDPLGKLVENGYTSNSDYSPWYCVGLFDTGAKMWRGKIDQGDITNDVKLAGATTAGGWCFEAFIPWDVIVDDLNKCTSNDPAFTKAEILAAAKQSKATIAYMDRFYDDEMRSNQTWGRYIIVPDYLADGTPGNMGSGDDIRSYGLTLAFATDAAAGGAGANGAGANGGASTAAGGAAGGASTTKAAGTGSGASSGSAQTLDVGIVIAAGALATSAIGIIATTKKKKK